jgi:hypothetical protein
VGSEVSQFHIADRQQNLHLIGLALIMTMLMIRIMAGILMWTLNLTGCQKSLFLESIITTLEVRGKIHYKNQISFH